MTVVYKCKHCGEKIGQLAKKEIDSTKLGWNALSEVEQKEMILNITSEKAVVQSICESCEQTLEQHPHYHELDYFIH